MNNKTTSNPKKISVLIVDDHPLMRAGLYEAVASQGDMEVVGESTNGREAVSAFLMLRPDVTIMDIVMPVLDGLTALHQIRQNDARARVIMLSTYKYEVQIHRAMQAGASGFLLKNTIRQDFITGIRNVHQGLPCMPAEIAVELVLNMGREITSRRETQILQYIAQGYSNRQIAAELAISDETVKTHVKNSLQKLGASDRTHAVAIALRRGIIANDNSPRPRQLLRSLAQNK